MTNNTTPYQRQIRLLRELRDEFADSYTVKEANIWYFGEMRDLRARVRGHTLSQLPTDDTTPHQRQLSLLKELREEIASSSTELEADTWYCRELHLFHARALRKE